jgi:hypothetical protein
LPFLQICGRYLKKRQSKTHNRWHPDIPMIETYKTGAEFRVECFDWTGGQIAPDDSANDVRDIDLTKIHYLSGLFGVDGAEPGDLMVVDLVSAGFTLGVYRYLRQREWRRLSGRPLSAGAQSSLGLSRHLHQFASHSGCALGRHRPSRADRLSAGSRLT